MLSRPAKAALVALSLLTGAGGLAVAQTAAPADPIAARKAGMKRMSDDMEAIKAVVDSRGDVRPLQPRAEEMVAFYRRAPSLFPPGSDSGDTKARPAIWSDRATFERANADALAASEKLLAAVTAGDQAATAAAFREVGASCGGCHRNFRNR